MKMLNVIYFLVILTHFNGIALQFYRIAVELHRSAKKQRCTLVSRVAVIAWF